ncbi:MAG: DUF1727 domain-containing protein [Chloroflexi bacterium]|nr:DUF1727 domain-containing protein [Chloroflexota bacterium]
MVGRVAARASRATGRRGSAIPGYVAELAAPGITARLATDLASVCLVSGTNGKTSTAHYLAGILSAAGRHVIANRSGANLQQAVASTLMAEAGAGGRLRHAEATAVLEVDEAALPPVVEAVPASVVVLTNLFRDQLDRFGETDRIVRIWAGMLERLPADTIIVWCADDPRQRALIGDRPRTVSFGLGAPDSAAGEPHVATDVSGCPVCGAALTYRWTSIAHLGAYGCPSCGFGRPQPWITVDAVERTFTGQTLRFGWAAMADRIPAGGASVGVRLPSLGNAYNAAAAVAAAAALGVQPAQAVAALAGLSVPFARFEELDIEGRRVVLALIKNPASLGELAQLIAGARPAEVPCVLLVFSDNHQDGRDVSWYWDVDPTRLVRGRSFVIAGRPGLDFEVRLKYLLVGENGGAIPGYLGMADSPAMGLQWAIAATPVGATCVVAATYTAMIALRAELASKSLTSAMPL